MSDPTPLPIVLIQAVAAQIRAAGVAEGRALAQAEWLRESHEREVTIAVSQAVREQADVIEELREQISRLARESEIARLVPDAAGRTG